MPVSKNRRKGDRKVTKSQSPKPPSKSRGAAPLAANTDDAPASMEALMADIQKRFGGGDFFDEDSASDPLFVAQDMMYDAWDEPLKRTRIKLARQALEISDICADAWTLLAWEAAKTVIETRDYLEKAVAAGEAAVRRALGPDAFEDEVGHFWGILETRPYMRARAALAESLWETGEREEAVAHWWDMLRLCPNDNLGIRHILGPRLVVLNQLRRARELLDEYVEESFVEWGYTHALLLFLQGGPNSGANKALKSAIDNNPYVPTYLLGAKRLPRNPPPHYALGSKEEAILYVLSSDDIWKSTKGALAWLDETVKNTL